MYKQLIIARRDLNMSPGKLAAQVAHAAMAFLIAQIKDKSIKYHSSNDYGYSVPMWFNKNLYEEWINDSFTKVVCGARNLGKLMKGIEKAESLGMIEGQDFFVIRDLCRTELEPEDEYGRTITCVGFIPMDEEIIDKIGKDFHLY